MASQARDRQDHPPHVTTPALGLSPQDQKSHCYPTLPNPISFVKLLLGRGVTPVSAKPARLYSLFSLREL